MRRLPLSFGLLLFAAWPLLGGSRSAVENGLLPAVPIEGEPGMKLEALATDWTSTASWRQVYRRRAEARLREGSTHP
ncbi:MAG: hypothetical protein ABI779_23895 [Acidobacteriota bacterium]